MASRDLGRQDASAGQTGATGDDPDPDLDAGRRRFLRRTAAGGAVAFGAVTVLAPTAFAQTPGTTPGSTPGTTPGSLPAAAGSSGSSGSGGGKKATVSGVDLTTLQFLQTVELALADLYEDAVRNGKLSSRAVDQAQAFGRHSSDHATRFGDFLQKEAPNKANAALVNAFRGRIAAAATDDELLGILRTLEDSAAATYQWAIGEVDEWEVAAVLATVEPVKAQHAVAWSLFAEDNLAAWVAQFDQYVPVRQEDTGRWDEAQYPVAQG